MSELLFFVLPAIAAFIAISLAGLPIYAVLRWMFHSRQSANSWKFWLLLSAAMAALPAALIIYDRRVVAECIERMGPSELSCTGEVGGAILEIFLWSMLVLAPLSAWLLTRFLGRFGRKMVD